MVIKTQLNITKLVISAADTSLLLSHVGQRNIAMFAVKQIDELTFEARIHERDISTLMALVDKHGGTCKIVHLSTIHRWFCQLPKRIMLFLGVVLILVLTVLIPRRVFFINVIGNSSVATNLILSKAESCGIYFGVAREDIRSEDIKNNLISAIPQLQWVGVNTKGCVAEISVREKDEINDRQENTNTVSNIVAVRDGVIISKTILEGTDACKVGQAVSTGQLLVSGYTDCGITIRATDAEAEILAQTKHEINTVTPTVYEYRNLPTNAELRYSITIGKKLIKLYKGSGISDSSCAKIYKRDYMQLPCGYYLPVSLITEHIYSYQTQETQQKDFAWLCEFAESYLTSQMIAGQIVSSEENLTVGTQRACLMGQYDCIEMIGQRILEENIDTYGVCN